MPTFFVRLTDGNVRSQGEWQEVDAATAEAAVQKVREFFPQWRPPEPPGLRRGVRRQQGGDGTVLSARLGAQRGGALVSWDKVYCALTTT